MIVSNPFVVQVSDFVLVKLRSLKTSEFGFLFDFKIE